MKTIRYNELTNEQARQWLMANDKEAMVFWRDSEAHNLQQGVADNLFDFGFRLQTSILIKGTRCKVTL